MGKRKEPPFYHTPQFKELYALWVTGKKQTVIEKGKRKVILLPSKLAQAGFRDIEKPNGTLKIKNDRTQSYLQQQALQRISSALSSYIENTPERLRPIEKRILELHSQGIYRKKIIEITQRSHQTVWKVIKKHTPLALGFYADEEEEG